MVAPRRFLLVAIGSSGREGGAAGLLPNQAPACGKPQAPSSGPTAAPSSAIFLRPAGRLCNVSAPVGTTPVSDLRVLPPANGSRAPSYWRARNADVRRLKFTRQLLSAWCATPLAPTEGFTSRDG